MGGGLSGLSAANILEKNGITPTIFEMKNTFDSDSPRAQTFISVFARPVMDCISHLADKLDIHINPHANITKIVFHSENESGTVKGNLGFIATRGNHFSSLENQLGNKLYKSDIIYNSKYTYSSLVQDFDVIILATGDPSYVNQIEIPGNYLKLHYKDALVSGNFFKNRIDIFQNHRIIPYSFGYLVPMSNNLANLKVSFPSKNIKDNSNINLDSINSRWQHFFKMINNKFGNKLSLLEVKEFSRIINQFSPVGRIGNSYFAGNCLGSLMPMLGFDQFFSISSGAYAAYSILGHGSYDDLKLNLMKQLSKLLTISQGMTNLNNSYYDAMTRALDTKAGEFFFDSKYDILKVLQLIFYPVVKIN